VLVARTGSTRAARQAPPERHTGSGRPDQPDQSAQRDRPDRPDQRDHADHTDRGEPRDRRRRVGVGASPERADLPGTLLVCGAPIGDIRDASPRLAEVLADADVIAAEDTRRVRRLAHALGVTITGRVVSCYDAVEGARAAMLTEQLLDGRSVALITDAGMPAVSDPGFRVVAAAAAAGVPISVVPGPSAVTAALAVSGLPSDRFTFEGFLPRRAGERRTRLRELVAEPRTMVFLEAPHRLRSSLGDLAPAFGPGRAAVLCRELTKTWEEIVRGDLGALVAWAADGREIRGEITLVVAGLPAGFRRSVRAAGPPEAEHDVGGGPADPAMVPSAGRTGSVAPSAATAPATAPEPAAPESLAPESLAPESLATKPSVTKPFVPESSATEPSTGPPLVGSPVPPPDAVLDATDAVLDATGAAPDAASEAELGAPVDLTTEVTTAQLAAAVLRHEAAGLSRADARRAVMAEFAVSRADVYAALLDVRPPPPGRSSSARPPDPGPAGGPDARPPAAGPTAGPEPR
jgi:16S rRNA (cytidine1402-2'-O)-methyltransferase